MMNSSASERVIEECISAYRTQRHKISVFGDSVRNFFASHPTLATGNMPAVHSVRYRIKDEDHLRDKIRRKNRQITADSLFKEITDLAGVRVLHLHMEQFEEIHREIK